MMELLRLLIGIPQGVLDDDAERAVHFRREASITGLCRRGSFQPVERMCASNMPQSGFDRNTFQT